MFANSLDNKTLFTRPDGIKVRDLTSSMFNMKANNYTSYEMYRVPREYEMRPDLIAAAVYNNTLFAEYILKFNGISNPFSIKEGDIILIPNLDSMTNITSIPEGSETDGAKTLRNSYKYIDPLKIPKKDDTFTDRQIIGGATEGSLPPNISEEGEKQITYRNGRVYFGEGVESCLQNGMTQSEFLTTVIKSKKIK